MAKRQVWLDNIKFIAMFLVVMYHTPPRCNCEGHVHELALFNLGAPVFFFAAGYLFNMARQQNFFSFLRHRARQILVPYTTFFVIFYALWLVVGRRMAGAEEQAVDVYTPLWQFITGQPDVVLGPFWFLACLFTMQLLYYPIRRYLSGWWPMAVAVLLSLSLFVIPAVPWVQYWNFDRALLYMPIYAFGNMVNPFPWKAHGVAPESVKPLADYFTLSPASRVALWCACAALGLGFLIFAPMKLDREVAYVFAPIAIVLVVPFYTACCRLMERWPALCRVARVVAITSITYLALQNYLIGIIKILVGKVMGPEILDGSLLFKVLIALAVMVALYPLALLVDRYFPFLLGKPYRKD